MLVHEESEAKRIMKSWSKEIVLFSIEKGPFRCQCGCDYQMTVGRVDRARCPKCNTLFDVEM